MSRTPTSGPYARGLRSRFAIACALAAFTLGASLAANQPVRQISRAIGVVYAMTNDPARNAVLMFRRLSNGQLVFEDRQWTGGRGGTGNGVGDVDPLGSQDSLVANGDGSRVLAVNAGSNEISLLAANGKRLALLDTVRSGGEFPNSVALHGDLVYVLNAHGMPNVTGFRIGADLMLHQLAGSTRALPGGSAAVPHDVRFSPDGTRLVVTEDGTNQIDVFDVGNDGLISGVTTSPSSGTAPFGFAFARDGVLVVTEAASASASSYEVTAANGLQPFSPMVANGQAATCWIALAPHGQAFVSNTASSTLSSYQVGVDGRLMLVDAAAANTGTGSAPIDAALSSDNRFLYVVDSPLGRILTFGVDGNNLVPLGSVTRLPSTMQGITAR
jgi:DNA-binding beta-propeller fold protein YncE